MRIPEEMVAASREEELLKVDNKSMVNPMKWDNSLKVSGCDKSIVLTERAFVELFVCGLCSRLISLDSVVSSCCKQPFCKSCVDEYASEYIREKKNLLPCPTCDDENSFPSTTESTDSECKTCCFTVNPLSKTQPLALQTLKVFTIQCLHESCAWKGNYSNFVVHLQGHQKSIITSEQKPSEYSNQSTEPELKRNRKERSYTIDSTHNVHIDDDLHNSIYFGDDDDAISLLQQEHSSNEGLNDHEIESSTVDSQMHVELFGQVERLKKQANAKFNAGKPNDARILYTKGIDMVNGIEPSTDDERRILSDMHSNRAATFYRFKKFDESIIDCEHAIRYEPELDKAWIRKWRSLMAKGKFIEAHDFLGEAVSFMPRSSRIHDEFYRSSKEMELLTSLNRLMDTGNMQQAEEVLMGSVDFSKSDNVLLFTHCAKLMVGEGDSKRALEFINMGLDVNPFYIDCIELQGLCHFFDGRFEQALRILKTSCDEHKNNTQIEKALMRVQTCYALYKEAEADMKNFRYLEANEHLTALINASEPIPHKSILFAKLRADRAYNALQLRQYVAALQDCQDVIEVHREYAPVWIIRADTLVALGKMKEAKKELNQIRRTWGENDATIESSYRKIDFEFRVSQAHDDVQLLLSSLEHGTCDKIPIFGIVDPIRRAGHTKKAKAVDMVNQPSTSMDRYTSHSKTDSRGSGQPPSSGTNNAYHGPQLANQSEPLRRTSCHARREIHSNSLVQAKSGITRKSSFHDSGLGRKSSVHEKHEENETHGIHDSGLCKRSSSHERGLVRKSSVNEKHEKSEEKHAHGIHDSGLGRRSSSHERGLVRKSSVHEKHEKSVEKEAHGIHDSVLCKRSSSHERGLVRKSIAHEKHEKNEAKVDHGLLDSGLGKRSSSHERGLFRRSSFHDSGLFRRSSLHERSIARKSSFHEKHGSNEEKEEHSIHDTETERGKIAHKAASHNARKPLQRRSSEKFLLRKDSTANNHNSTEDSHGTEVKNNLHKHPERRLSDKLLSRKDSLVNDHHDTDKNTDQGSDRVRKSPARSKSCEHLFRRSSSLALSDNETEADKGLDHKQAQRMKTLDGIFGCDWQQQSNETIDTQPCVASRPGARRSKSTDIFELRKMLIGQYCPKVDNKYSSLD